MSVPPRFARFRVLTVAFCVTWAWGPLALAQETYQLQSDRAPNQFDRVEATLQVGGDLVVSDDPKHTRPKMSVVAKVVYEERLLQTDPNTSLPRRSIRRYDAAEAVIKVENESVRPELPEDRRLIGAATDGTSITLFCPVGPLTRDQLDLVDIVGNSLVLDRLLPEKPVALNASWEHDKEVMGLLLGLDEVVHSDAKSTLVKVTEKSAIAEMSGQVQGTVGGGATTIAMKAKYRFDFRTRRINWFGLAINEQRSAGSILRGVDVVAKMQMELVPAAPSAPLSDAALQGMRLEPDAASTQLVFQPPAGGWRIVHSRDWYVARDENRTAVLGRYVNDEWLVNCTISGMPKLGQGQDVTLQQFQADVQKALGENFGRFLRAAQFASSANHRVFCVEVQGKAKTEVQGKPTEVPMVWHYYRVADRHGHQVVLAFSIEEPMLPRLEEADKALVESLRFTQAAVAARPLAPTPADLPR